MESIKERAQFNFIRYANCWEDADILIEGLDIQEGDTCLSIASAGDNSLSLLTRNPAKVIAVDLNPTQIAISELRVAAFRHLSYDHVLQLLGVTESDQRITLFNIIKHDLSANSIEFFRENLNILKDGVVKAGKFENYFSLFSKKLLPFIHGRKIREALVKDKSIEQQHTFYDKIWDNIRWRLLFKIFFSRKVMGKHGRDPEFFKYVKGSVADRIMDRTKYAFTEIKTYTNPYLNFILYGNFPPHALPHYLRKENFNTIKKNIDRIELFFGSIDDALSKPNLSINACNLSDIFEYMNQNEYKQMLKRIYNKSAPKARIAFWNMLADRELTADIKEFTYLKEASESLFMKDKAFFYKRFIIGEIAS